MGKYNVKHVLFLRADNPRRRCAPMQGVAGRALEAVGIEFIKQYDGQEQVGCAKLASANIETVFSGAGRISNKSRLLAAQVLSDYCFRHYNYHFDWLRPQLDEIIKAYLQLYGPQAHDSDAEDGAYSSAGEEEEEEEGDKAEGEEAVEADDA